MKINICAVQLATRPIWVSWERWVGFRSLDLGEINFPLHALYPSPLLLVLGYRYILDLKQISFTWFISFSSPPSTRIQIYQTQRRYPSYNGYPSPLLLLLGYRYTKPRGDILYMLDILLLSSRIQVDLREISFTCWISQSKIYHSRLQVYFKNWISNTSQR